MAARRDRVVAVVAHFKLAGPCLSIIVPLLNERKGLQTFLRALQPLRFAGAELIVVDGGSRDGTFDLLQGDYATMADRVLHSRQGRARQMNKGARAARSDLLLFLHADTVLPPETLALLANTGRLMENGWGCFNVRLSGSHSAFRLIEWFMNHRSRLTGIATGDQGIVVTRTLFESIGGFNALPLMEDIDLCRRLRRLKPPQRIAGAVVTSSRRWEVNGIIKTVLLMWRLRLAYFMGVPAERLWRHYR